jgi:ribosomal protein S30
MSAPGLLHNLSLEIVSNAAERWYAHSSHQVAAVKPQLERRSASGSATPSPHKQRKRSPPRLQSWTVYLSQIIKASKSQKRDAKEDKEFQDSETESDEDSSESNANDLLTAWYIAHFDASQAALLTKDSGEVSWQTVELAIRVAWDKGGMDVLGSEQNKGKDGTYSSIKVSAGKAGILDTATAERKDVACL